MACGDGFVVAGSLLMRERWRAEGQAAKHRRRRGTSAGPVYRGDYSGAGLVPGVGLPRRYHVRLLMPRAIHGLVRLADATSYWWRGVLPAARRLASLRCLLRS